MTFTSRGTKGVATCRFCIFSKVVDMLKLRALNIQTCQRGWVGVSKLEKLF